MAYNSIRGFFSFSGAPEFMGYEELVDALLIGRKSSDFGGRSHLSDSQIRRLIKIAYFATFSPDEGRFPAFHAFSDIDKEVADELRTVVEFDKSVAVSVEFLKSISPTLSAPEYALRIVGEDGDQVSATAYINLRPARSSFSTRPEFWLDGLPVGLHVRGVAPGHLRVMEGSSALELRGGRLTELVGFDSVPIVRDWLLEACNLLFDAMSAEDSRASTLFGGQIAAYPMIRQIWANILGKMVDAKHGGAVVLLPSAAAANLLVEIKYRIKPASLSAEFKKYWLAAVQARADSG